MAAKSKCPCGCGQAPADTTRLRKAACPDCGYIVRLSRTTISRGLPTCPCGLTLEPECLHDAVAAPGDIGAAAYSELCARETDRAVRSDHARRRVLKPGRCGCGSFRPLGANCDPSAPAEPCPKCGSVAPVLPTLPKPSRPVEPAMPF